MKKIVVFIAIIVTSNLLAGNYANWQEHSLAFLNSQQQLHQQLGVGTVVTVGSDANCDFSLGSTKIQDAIDSGADEVRIVSETYVENLEIIDISVNLIGGYANCTDAANNISNGSLSTVNGGFSGSVVDIRGATQSNTINIANMLIQSGNGGTTQGGGINIRSADLTLNLNNILLFNNTALINGGGIQVFQGNTSINIKDVQIVGNFANRGGGIYCIGDQNSIILTGTYGITQNQATSSDGGGAMLVNGCDMTSYVGTTSNPPLAGISLNQAADHGGGVALSGGSRLSLIGSQFCSLQAGCIGDNELPASIASNEADTNDDNTGNGGGIYATGSGTIVDAIAVDINGNKARNGGGISIEDGATFNTGFSNPDCWSPGSCNQIRNNQANNFGGAIYASGNNTVAAVDVSHIQANRANGATAAYIIDGADLTVTASVITGNGNQGNDGFNDSYLFRVFGGGNSASAELKIQASTLADNNTINAILSNIDSSLTVLSSIIHDPSSGDVYTSSNPVLEIFSCVMAHEIASAPPSFNTVEDNPEFVDRMNGDFHLNPMISPAIDFCANTNNTNVLTDVDLEVRGWDDPNVININGAYDVGADESYGGDIIFKDGFDN